MQVRIQTFLYLLLLFFLPTQFGKHFWPDFSFVNGLAVDYLSPTLFFTDILVVFLFVFYLASNPLIFPLKIFITKKNILITLFTGLLAIGIVFSKSPLAGWYGGIKVLEFVFFAYYTARVLGKTVSFFQASVSLSLAVLFQSLLGIGQFFAKGSIGGIFYFFGERSFTMLTPGIANASISGQLILRSYGSLPHPNVLAAFLLISLLFIIGNWSLFSTRLAKGYIVTVCLVAVIALGCTLSRSVIFLGVVFLVFETAQIFWKKQLRKFWWVGLLLLTCAVVAFYTPLPARFSGSSFLEESFVIREDLTKNALWMISTHLFFGVGLENFLQNLPLSSSSSFAYYSLLQPVHNIYLLVFAQAGIPAGLLFLYFLYSVLVRLSKANNSTKQKTAIYMLVALFFLGLLDHYFLTLQQGRFLFAFVIGFCFSLTQKNNKKKRKMRYNKTL